MAETSRNKRVVIQNLIYIQDFSLTYKTSSAAISWQINDWDGIWCLRWPQLDAYYSRRRGRLDMVDTFLDSHGCGYHTISLALESMLNCLAWMDGRNETRAWWRESFFVSSWSSASIWTGEFSLSLNFQVHIRLKLVVQVSMMARISEW